MELRLNGKIIRGIGGIYTIRLNTEDADRLFSIYGGAGDTLNCRARGVFRHGKLAPLVGDEVTVRVDTELLAAESVEEPHTGEALAGVMIEDLHPRRSELIRPPLANLDMLYIVFSCTEPEPSLTITDKLTTIADFKQIEPVIVVTKADLAPEKAEEYAVIYKKCGFDVFVEGIGFDCGSIDAFIHARADKTSAFAGTSGVGKSTLMNRLFPSLGLETGEVSKKTGHGRHTTRHTELYPLDEQFGGTSRGYIADTPGFGMLDFVKFDFYTKEDLPYVFREFAPYIGECRYKKCTHTKEEGCAVLGAVRDGIIPKERHDSYLEFYSVLKDKHDWKN